MRSWWAVCVLLLGCVFAAHATVSAAQRYDLCCILDCQDAAGACEAACTACAQPATALHSTPLAQAMPAARGLAVPGPALAAPFLMPWRPPG